MIVQVEATWATSIHAHEMFVGTLIGTTVTCCGSAYVHMDKLPSSPRLMVIYKLSAEKGPQPLLTTELPQELFIRV